MLPQLANTYNPTKNYGHFQWAASPKLDGIRALYIPGEGLISRSKKTQFVGFSSIERMCESICKTDNLSFIDGELYIPGEKFDIISGIVRKSKNYDLDAKFRVELKVFAVGSIDAPLMPAGLMYDLIRFAIPDTGKVNYLPQTYIKNTPTVVQSFAELVKNNGDSDEGIMLRNSTSVYASGRSDNLLKVKNFVKSNFVIVGFTKGTGKYAKSLGNVLIRGMVDGKIINAKVGTGFNDSERSNIWTNQSNYLGKDIEVIYLGVTANESLRHPIFSKLV